MLFEKLNRYAQSDKLRFHMPGHKGRGTLPEDVAGFDITEIPGFDDLHDPSDSIKKLNEKIRKLYGCRQASFLVGGSTSGILSAIYGMIKDGDKVLLPRNCHKSVYHALMLRHAKPVFVYPKVSEFGYPLPITSEDIKGKLESEEDIRLAIITSPTYEGYCSEIADIKSVLEDFGIPLFADGAHGAHLGIFEAFPPNPITRGADVEVVSLHKTLPFLTQSAALLFSDGGEEYSQNVLTATHIFETSSPSYLLMGWADRELDEIILDKDRIFCRFSKNLKDFYEKARNFKQLELITDNRKEPSKLLICKKNVAAGAYIFEALRRAGIEPEMASEGYCLLMTSVADRKEDFDKLYEVLKALDAKTFPEIALYTPQKHIESLQEVPMEVALMGKWEEVAFENTIGSVSSGFIDLFPPGIPLLIPGEIIKKEHIDLVKNAKKFNINVRGLKDNKIRCYRDS